MVCFRYIIVNTVHKGERKCTTTTTTITTTTNTTTTNNNNKNKGDTSNNRGDWDYFRHLENT